MGTGKDITIKKLAETVQKAVGHNGEITWDSSKPDGTPRKKLNYKRFKSLGWEPTINLKKGLEQTICDYRKKSKDGSLRK